MGKKFKYLINSKLIDIEKEHGRKAKIEATKRIITRLNISESQFWRIKTYQIEDNSSATSDQLIIIAEELNCSVDDLLNKQELLLLNSR